MTSYHKKSVRVHTAIADPVQIPERGVNANALWLYCRGEDESGQGWVDIRLKDATEVLGITKRTFYRYLADGQTLGFFRSVTRLGNKWYRIYYSALGAICLKYGISKLGACAEISLEDIKKRKLIITEAEVERQQKSSRRLAKLASGKKRLSSAARLVATSQKSAKPSKRPKSQRSLKKRGKGYILAAGKGKIFVHANFTSYGVSQQTIANVMGRTRATINRRLSNKTRQKKGMAPLDRAQIFRQVPGQDAAIYQHRMKWLNCNTLSHDIKAPRRSVFEYKGNIWETLPNLYDTGVHLVPAIVQRRKISKALQTNTKE